MTSVAICIPTIPPRAKMLRRAFGSATRQTVAPDEICVASDINGYGAAQTRNRAMAMAQAEWIAPLDDDDILYPQHLEVLLAHQRATGADLVYPYFDVIGPDGEPAPERDPFCNQGHTFDPDELDRRNWIPVTYLVRRELAMDVGGFPELGSERWPHDNCEDWGFLRDLRDAGATFSHLGQRTWAWFHHFGNTSGRPWRRVLAA